MKVMILGMDGYLGWSLALHLSAKGHTVGGLDNYMRRSWVTKMRSVSAMPIETIGNRLAAFGQHFESPDFREISMDDYPALCTFLQEFQPDAIVHLAECPSAPYSMQGVHEAAFVMRNNVVGTLYLLYAMRDYAPDAHLIKLGTMGEYGTPDIDIPEGFFEIEYRGRKDKLSFPRKAGSWYHWTKVHDSMNINFACDIWGLRSTDIMQGVVYGTWIEAMGYDHRLRTRVDFDESFGTVINRFVCQAIVGHPLTIFGNIGKQTRGFLPLHDSMQCLTLAIENPPDGGEYRVFNQFEETYSVIELAKVVQEMGNLHDLDVKIGHYDTPRIEVQEHYYNPDHDNLMKLGYEPDHDMKRVVGAMLEDLIPFRERIMNHADALVPEIRWSGPRRKSVLLRTPKGADK